MDEAAREQNREKPIQVTAIVMSSREENLYYAMDVEGWVREGLVDAIIPYTSVPRLNSGADSWTDPGDARFFQRITRGTPCRLALNLMPRQARAEYPGATVFEGSHDPFPEFEAIEVFDLARRQPRGCDGRMRSRRPAEGTETRAAVRGTLPHRQNGAARPCRFLSGFIRPGGRRCLDGSTDTQRQRMIAMDARLRWALARYKKHQSREAGMTKLSLGVIEYEQ